MVWKKAPASCHDITWQNRIDFTSVRIESRGKSLSKKWICLPRNYMLQLDHHLTVVLYAAAVICSIYKIYKKLFFTIWSFIITSKKSQMKDPPHNLYYLNALQIIFKTFFMIFRLKVGTKVWRTWDLIRYYLRYIDAKKNSHGPSNKPWLTKCLTSILIVISCTLPWTKHIT